MRCSIRSILALSMLLVWISCNLPATANNLDEPVIFSGDRITSPGTYRIFLNHDGLQRYYLVHLPPQLTEGKPLPLVLCLHGAGSNAEHMRQWTELDFTADKYGFVAIYPAGSGRYGNLLLTWNAGPTCCGYSLEQEIDDVGFIKSVLKDAAIKFPVDQTRVYATGFSNGAMMTYRLAHEMSRRLAAIAPVAGAMMFEPFQPKAPVSVMHIHSLADPHAPYNGGVSHSLALAKLKLKHFSVEETLNQWIKFDGVQTPPQLITTISGTPGTPDEHHSATCLLYRHDQSDAEIVLWKLSGGGHVWPGGNKSLSDDLLGAPTSVVNANELLWNFFREHSRPDAPPLTEGNGEPASPTDERTVEKSRVEDGNKDPFASLGPIPQAVFEFYFAKTAMGLDFDGTNRSEFEDWGGEIQSQRGEATVTAALYTRLALGMNQHSVFSLLFNCKAQYQTLTFDPYEDLKLWRGGTGLSALYISNANNLYYFFGGVAIAEDVETISEPTLIPLAVGLGTKRFDDRRSLLYGGLATSIFGKILPIPMIGYSITNPYGFRFAALLPLFITVGYIFDNGFELYGYCIPDGGLYHLDDSWRGAESDELQLSITQIRAGVLGIYKLSETVKIQFGSGIISARTLTILDDDTKIDETIAEPAGFLNAGLQIVF